MNEAPATLGRVLVLVRLAVSAGLLAGLFRLLDGDVLVRRLRDLDPVWVMIGLGLSLPQMALLALRWRITAARLGLALPFGAALREYYLATFLNQLLPGGVMGDITRAWRHGRAAPVAASAPVSGVIPDASSGTIPRTVLGPAARAVILERASGQVVMGVVAVLALASLPLAGAVRGWTALAVVAAALALGTRLLRQRRDAPSVWHDAHRALLARDVIGIQLGTSALVVASYLAIYVAAARAVGLPTPLVTLVPLIPPVLLSMLIPVTIAGWGVREASAAGLWSAVGLTAEDGVAASAAYGLLVLASTLPGALVLLSAGRGRRGGPRQVGSDGSEDAAPARGSPPAGG